MQLNKKEDNPLSMRTHARQMAHIQMELAGHRQVNREHYIKGERQPSFFKTNWKTYAKIPKEIAMVCAKERAKREEKRDIRNFNRAFNRVHSWRI